MATEAIVETPGKDSGASSELGKWVITSKDAPLPEGPYKGLSINSVFLRDMQYVLKLIEQGHYKPSWQMIKLIDDMLKNRVADLEQDNKITDPASYGA
jgi:hypothetical protein